MRQAILALLLLGSQYGLQLRNEFEKRSGIARRPNSGQVYQTLERLIRSKHVTVAGFTNDGLPLYEITTKGRDEALVWLNVPETTSSRFKWDTMVNQVLIVSSLPGFEVEGLIQSYCDDLEQALANLENYQFGDKEKVSQVFGKSAGFAVRPGSAFRNAADRAQFKAALDWLSRVEGQALKTYPVDEERPKRGRPTKG